MTNEYDAELARAAGKTGVPLPAMAEPKAVPAPPPLGYTQENLPPVSRDADPSPWALLGAGLCAVVVMCALLAWLKRARGVRLFGDTAIERLGGLLFWPPMLLLMLVLPAAFVSSGDFFNTVVPAIFPTAHGEPFVVFVVNSFLLGMLLRFVLLPLLSWLRTGRWRRSRAAK